MVNEARSKVKKALIKRGSELVNLKSLSFRDLVPSQLYNNAQQTLYVILFFGNDFNVSRANSSADRNLFAVLCSIACFARRRPFVNFASMIFLAVEDSLTFLTHNETELFATPSIVLISFIEYPSFLRFLASSCLTNFMNHELWLHTILSLSLRMIWYPQQKDTPTASRSVCLTPHHSLSALNYFFDSLNVTCFRSFFEYFLSSILRVTSFLFFEVQ